MLEIVGLEDMGNLAGLTLKYKDSIKMGRTNNLHLDIDCLDFGIKMHIDGESMNVYGRATLDINFLDQVNMIYGDLKHF